MGNIEKREFPLQFPVEQNDHFRVCGKILVLMMTRRKRKIADAIITSSLLPQCVCVCHMDHGEKKEQDEDGKKMIL